MTFELTGNPFVDTGLYVLSHLAGVDSPEQLSVQKVRALYGNGTQLAKINSRLKSFTMVFGTNGPLTQSGYRPTGQKKTVSQKNIMAYTAVLSALLREIDQPSPTYPICEICGRDHAINFDATVRPALEKAGVPDKGARQIGREWFPLAGSLGNDAQSLPSASRSLSVCARCLFAVHYMPLGLMLMQGRLVCFQSGHTRIAAELTAEIATEYQDISRATREKIEMLGRKEGTTAVARRLLLWMSRVQEVRREDMLPDSAALTVWLFSNAGANPDCDIVEIPNHALQFLWQARKFGYERDLLSLLAGESKGPDFQLLTCIQAKRDYSRLYPFKTFRGASPGLFALYHQAILGETAEALKSAQRLADARLAQATTKERKILKKAETLRNDLGERNRFRKLMLDLGMDGRFTSADYELLFQPRQIHPIRVDPRGWRTIAYYLSNPNGEIPNFSGPAQGQGERMKPHPKIKQIAQLYFNDYVASKGIERLAKDIIDGFRRANPNGVLWLRTVYLDLAKKHPGFTLEDWDEFVQDENGQPQAYELLFQMRLELANLYREHTQSVKTPQI